MDDLSESDKEKILGNIRDARLLSNVINKGFGPFGIKVATNLVRDILVADSTCDILDGVDMRNPSAQILLLQGKEQQNSSGDGVILTLSLAGELLKKAGKLIQKKNVHPRHILNGYKTALLITCQHIKEWAFVGPEIFDARNKSHVTLRIDSVISSHVFRPVEGLSAIIAEACIEACPKEPKTFDVEKVAYFLVDSGLGSTIPAAGKVIRGIILHATIRGSVKSIENGKVAVFSCGIDTFEQLDNSEKTEVAKVEEFIATVANCGANVIVSDTDVGEQALLCCNIHKLMFLKVRSKSVLRRLCRTTGAIAMSKPRQPKTEELGFADSISVEVVGGSAVVIVKNEATCDPTCTIVLPHVTESNHDSFRRAIMAGISAYKAMCMDGEIVLGAGATEFQLSRELRELEASLKLKDEELWAFQKFVKSLEMVPRRLAKNRGCDGSAIVKALNTRYEHWEINLGIDLENGICKDVRDMNIWDLLSTKLNALKNAYDAAIAVLLMYLV